MSFIKSRKIFEADIRDQETLDNSNIRYDKYKKDITEYKSKKTNLENLIFNNKENKDIKNEVARLIGTNKILALYLPIVNIKKDLNDIDVKVQYDNQSLTQANSDLSLANNLADKEDREEQVKKINDRIAETKQRITDNEAKLNAIQKQIKTEEDAFNKKIDMTKKDFEDKMKNLKKGETLRVKGLNSADNNPVSPKDVNTISRDLSR